MRAPRSFILFALFCTALSGCVRQPASVMRAESAATPARGDLDRQALDRHAYGQMRDERPVRVAYVEEWAAPAASPYRLDAGDRLRIVVYGQEGLTNTYAVDAGGMITLPLIGAVAARGATPAELARAIAARLRQGYVREPHVAAEIEAYRPFFILGEVAAPGQYPYVPNMTAESAVAIAGGFTARASRGAIDLSRTTSQGPLRGRVPLATPIRPGDTLVVGERWF